MTINLYFRSKNQARIVFILMADLLQINKGSNNYFKRKANDTDN